MFQRLLLGAGLLLASVQQGLAAPTVALTAPADHAAYAAPGTITLTATAAGDGVNSVSQVDFYVGSTLIGSAPTAPYTVTWSNVGAGSYNVTAVATDTASASSASTPINLSVFTNLPPTVSVTATPNNATALATITLNATAADSDGSVSQVDFFNGPTLLGSVTQAPYTYNWSNVGAGSYTVTAKATDNLGTSTTSSLATVTVAAYVPDAQVYYVQPDHLNTPRLIVTAGNSVVWRWDSDPFGMNTPNQDPGNSGTSFAFNPRFPGQYFDKEVNLHFNYFRDYDPGTGLYIESDPIGLRAGVNTYAYVGGNPVGYVDPLGLWRMPDYGTVTVPTPIPLVGVTFTLDRSGNMYVGPSFGVNLPGASGRAWGVGWTGDKCTPDSKHLQDFLGGWSYNVGVGVGMTSSGSGVPGGGSPESTGMNIQTPGISAGYNWGVGNIGIHW